MRGLSFRMAVGFLLLIILGISFISEEGTKITLVQMITYAALFVTFLTIVKQLHQESKEKYKQIDIKIIDIEGIVDLEYKMTEEIRKVENDKIFEKEVITVQIINDKQAMICYKS